jgi:hypothetical protein
MEMDEEEDADEEEWREAWDDVRGGSLKYNEVVEARREEIEYTARSGIWELKPIAKCWERTGKGPTGVRWVDTNKGSEAESDVRCRLVARDFRQKRDNGREDLFAETPPLEAIRMRLSKAVTRRMRGSKRGCRKIMFIDARKAHLNPWCEEDVYIELPEEAGHEEGMCGKLRHWLY